MTIKTAGALRLTDIKNEYTDVFERETDIRLAPLAEDADLTAPHAFSEFYGMSSGPTEIFSSFIITTGQHTHLIEWTVTNPNGDDPTGTVYVYGALGDSVVADENTLLSPDGIDLNSQTNFSHYAGHNTRWSYQLRLVNERGAKTSEQRIAEAVPTLPSFESQVQLIRDIDNLGTDEAQKDATVVFDLVDEIAFSEGYTMEVYFKANDNQSFAQIDSTLSRSTAANSENPIIVDFAAGDAQANQAKRINLSAYGHEFDLFTRYTVAVYILWTGEEGMSRGLLDFAGDRPEIPLLTSVMGPATIQINWSHDNKTTRYQLYRHSQEVDVVGSGQMIYEIDTSGEAEDWTPVTQYLDDIGYNTEGYYVVRAYTEYDQADSSVKRVQTLTTNPELDGSLSVVRDPDFAGYNTQTLVACEWDMKEGGPDYSESYTVEFYYRAQDSGFADTSLTRQNADNAGNAVTASKSGSGPQSVRLSDISFAHLQRYTILMVLTWTGQEVSSRAFLEQAGLVPDPARGFSVFQSGTQGLRVSWNHDDKADRYRLYGSSSTSADLRNSGDMLQESAGGPASYEYTQTLGYSETRFYQVESYNEYSTVLSGVRSGSTSEPSLAITGQAARSGSQMTDISVSWTVLPADLTSYSVSITVNGTSMSGIDATAGSKTFSGMAPDHNSTYRVEFTLSWGSKSPARTTATVPIFTASPLPMPTSLTYSNGIVSWSLSNTGQSVNVTDYRLAAAVWRLHESAKTITTPVSQWLSSGSTASYNTYIIGRYVITWAIVAYQGTINGLPASESPRYEVTERYGRPEPISLSASGATKNSCQVTLSFTTPTGSSPDTLAQSVTYWVVNWTGGGTSGIAKSGSNPTGNQSFTASGLPSGAFIQFTASAYWYSNQSQHTVTASAAIQLVADYSVTMDRPLLSWVGNYLKININNVVYKVAGGTGKIFADFGVSGCTKRTYSVGEAGSYGYDTPFNALQSVDQVGNWTLTLSATGILKNLGYTHSWFPTGGRFQVRITVQHPMHTSGTPVQVVSSIEEINTVGVNAHTIVPLTTGGQASTYNPAYGTGSKTYTNGATSTAWSYLIDADYGRKAIQYAVRTRNGLDVTGVTINGSNARGSFRLQSWKDSSPRPYASKYGAGNQSPNPTIIGSIISWDWDSRDDRSRGLQSFSPSGSVTVTENALFNPQTIFMPSSTMSMPRMPISPRYSPTGVQSGNNFTYTRRLRYGYWQGTTEEDGLEAAHIGTVTTISTRVTLKYTNGTSWTGDVTPTWANGEYPYFRHYFYNVSQVTIFYTTITLSVGGFTTSARINGNYGQWLNSSNGHT